MEHNPYEAVDISAIPIREITNTPPGKRVFHAVTSAVSGFDACVFRQNLFDLLHEIARDEWIMTGDSEFGPNDLKIVLSEADAKKFVSYGWLIGA